MTFFNFQLTLVSLLFIVVPARSQPDHLLKIATLAPEGSSWVKTVRSIDIAIRDATEGRVGFKIYPGGVQGDEKVVLRKIRIGQLHGGGFAGLGISQIFPDVLALEMPFLFNSYAEVDYVLDQMDKFYQIGYKESGYEFLGWADIGFVHILSKQPVKSVGDIRSLKVWQLADEPITEVLFRLAKVQSVPLSIPDVLLGLQTSLIDVVYASPSAAIVLQWFTRVKHVTDLPINYTLGALLIQKKAFDKIPSADQERLRKIAKEHMAQLGHQIRKENQEAMEVLQANGLSIVHSGPIEIATFRDLVSSAQTELVGTAFSNDAHKQIQHHLAQFRKTPSPP